MITVKQVLKEKGQDIWSATPDTSVYEALKLMSEKDIGALLVLEGDKLVGIMSERDYARKIILQGRSSLGTPVREIMTGGDLITISLDCTMGQCMRLMTDERVRHLPVLDEDEKVIGIVSIGDVVKEIIAEQKDFIRDLQNYIEGRGYAQ